MFYVLDENHNLKEALDKEGVLSLLEAAIENGDLESVVSDSAFVDKLKCSVNGGTFHVAFITQAKYNELLADNQLITDCIYYITDDTTCEDLDAALQIINNSINDLDDRVSNIENSSSRLAIMGISSETDLLTSGFDLSSYLPLGQREKTIGIAAEATVSCDDGTSLDLCFNTLWCSYFDETNKNTFARVLTMCSNANDICCIKFSIEIEKETNILKVLLYNTYSIMDNTTKTVTKIRLKNLNIYY